MSMRDQGAIAFAHVQDQTGRLQFFLRKNEVAAHRRRRAPSVSPISTWPTSATSSKPPAR
jgi:lysyl-tRNA synthetase class II